jgi:hypothetical protein
MAGAGGPGPSVSAGRRAAQIWRTATGSSTGAITRSRPPQRGHGTTNTSIANTRRIIQWVFFDTRAIKSSILVREFVTRVGKGIRSPHEGAAAEGFMAVRWQPRGRDLEGVTMIRNMLYILGLSKARWNQVFPNAKEGDEPTPGMKKMVGETGSCEVCVEKTSWRNLVTSSWICSVQIKSHCRS